MTSDSTSTPTATDKSSAAYLKRREQVRRAQRTHRERKESYIHALESEVVALRTKARSVEEQNDALSLEIGRLRSQLDAQQGSTACTNWDTTWFGDFQDDGLTSTSDYNEEQCLSTPDDIPTWERELPGEDVPTGVCGAVVRRPAMSKSWSIPVNHADMAMEFVLTLEKPCIQRAQSVVFDPLNAYPLNHSTSNAELALYHSFVEYELATSDSCTRADVASSLDNLLTLSSAFCLENEVTPIQAWQQLCEYLEFGVVDTKGLKMLVDALLEHVRCYGFGAVIPKSVFDATCSRVFTIGTG